jgi:hypothetical protein
MNSCFEIARKEPHATFYRIHNSSLKNNLLKFYSGVDGPFLRALTSFTVFSLIGRRKPLGTEISEAYQRKVVALSGLPENHWNYWLGRVLLVEDIAPIPIDFIIEDGKGIVFVKNGEVVSRNDALALLNVSEPEKILSAIESGSASIYSEIRKYLEARDLSIENLIMNFGIGRDEKGALVPIWAREGLNPKTALVYDRKERMMDVVEFAQRIIPPSVYKKDIGRYLPAYFF